MTQEEVIAKLFKSFEEQNNRLEKRAKWSEYKFWGVLSVLVLIIGWNLYISSEPVIINTQDNDNQSSYNDNMIWK